MSIISNTVLELKSRAGKIWRDSYLKPELVNSGIFTGLKVLFQIVSKLFCKLFSFIFRHYRDIDLFVGGLSESESLGSILGPTFACLNGIQFHHWKYGDRFYFEHGGEAGSFTIGNFELWTLNLSLNLMKILNQIWRLILRTIE